LPVGDVLAGILTLGVADAGDRDADDALVQRVLAGETARYAELVRRYQRMVRRLARAMLATEEETDNVVQQSFVNAYRSLAQYHQAADFDRWLKMIARNVVRDEIRKRARKHDREAAYREYLVARMADEDPGDEQARRGALQRCRDKLPPPAAEAVSLRYEQGLPFRDVAAALGRSEEATRQLLFRTRTLLRRCIEEELHREDHDADG
jgi:RNA polymerase sigma-70 factor (ECF subfamily)